MKKLMVAAAVAAFGLASFAEEGKCGPDCAWAYKVQMVARTTVAGSSTNASKCVGGCFRKPTMGKIVGYIWGSSESEEGACGGCGCNDWSAGKIVLWNNYSRKQMALDADAPFEVIQLNRIGRDNTSVAEGVFKMNFANAYADATATVAPITLAGFGPCGHQKSGKVAIRSISGFFAGQLTALCQSYNCGEVEGATPSTAWVLCQANGANVAVTEGDAADGLTAAYGKWKFTWDSYVVSRMINSAWAPVAPYGYAQAVAQEWEAEAPTPDPGS